MSPATGTFVAVPMGHQCRTPSVLVPRTRQSMATQSPSDANTGSNAPSGTIRRRITTAMSIEFVLVMGVAAIEGFWPGAGPGGGTAIAFLIVCMLVVPAVMAGISRPFLRDLRLLDEENARLRDLYGRARLDATLDGLTMLGNHRAFQEELARQLEHAGRTGSSIALLLMSVGRTVMSSMRRNDRAFRVGGDEFAIILPGADVDTALTAARRILAG